MAAHWPCWARWRYRPCAARAEGSKRRQLNLRSLTRTPVWLPVCGRRKVAQEEQEVESIANLLVRSMVNAAKADGRVDKTEFDKIVGKVGADGVSKEEQEFLLSEFRKPMDTDSIVRAVPSQQVAAQVYAASLLAVELDTPAEKQYLEQLGQKLGLAPNVTAYLHRTVGVA